MKTKDSHRGTGFCREDFTAKAQKAHEEEIIVSDVNFRLLNVKSKELFL